MSRIGNTNPPSNDPQAVLAAHGLVGKHVCPFCGTISEHPEAACKRCTMENTPLTRQATRARIGPWYVMQSRNPSAPGMKLNTLLALIRRGQVAPRSIIRGPTTHQLWRFAIRVKGVSREFGHCYSCGSELQTTAAVCARCGKSQEMPANPDALLEGDGAPRKTVFMEVKAPRQNSGEEPVPADSSVSGNGSHGTSGSNGANSSHGANGNGAGAARPTMEEPQIHPATLAAPSASRPVNVPSPTATMAALAGLPSPELAGPELQSRPRSQQIERVLSPRELAAAFSLQFNPNSDGIIPPPPPEPGLNWRAISGVAVLLLLFGGAGTIYFVPAYRTKAFDWLHKTYMQLTSVTESGSPAVGPGMKVTPSDRPDWAMPAPTDSTPITTPGTNNAPAATPSRSPAPGITTPAPQSSPGAAIDHGQNPGPSAQLSGSSLPPDPAPSTPARTANSPPPGSASGQDQDNQAMALRRQGLDAEARHDYAAAVSYYEQIERLSHDHWPSDTDQLLQAAKKRAAPAKSPGR